MCCAQQLYKIADTKISRLERFRPVAFAATFCLLGTASAARSPGGMITAGRRKYRQGDARNPRLVLTRASPGSLFAIR